MSIVQSTIRYVDVIIRIVSHPVEASPTQSMTGTSGRHVCPDEHQYFLALADYSFSKCWLLLKTSESTTSIHWKPPRCVRKRPCSGALPHSRLISDRGFLQVTTRHRQKIPNNWSRVYVRPPYIETAGPTAMCGLAHICIPYHRYGSPSIFPIRWRPYERARIKVPIVKRTR